MQFNSYLFILAFLPGILLLYFLSNKINLTLGKIVLLAGSILFYGYANPKTLLFLGLSLLCNYAFLLLSRHSSWKKVLLGVPVLINVLFLLYFKYTNFAITSLNHFLGKDYALRSIFLPVGISFITFQQIAYLVSAYRKQVDSKCLLDYLVYILYFPKISMGPLTEPVDFLAQLNDPTNKTVNPSHLAEGLKIFSFGLFKKMLLADTFALAVSWGFSNFDSATAMDLFLVMLAYTFEIYFDFSGYSDMAVGVSRMFNITLPINFDSPYKALSIRDFWKRWHISLTKFLTQYIYIPLGGNRKGAFFTYFNTMVVFIVSGIWHGANWTFILWGIQHGIFSITDRIFETAESRLMETVRWAGTFLCVNVLWLLFRADSIHTWLRMLKKIFFLQSTAISDGLLQTFVLPESAFLNQLLHLSKFTQNIRGFWMLVFFAVAFLLCLVPQNNYKKISDTSLCTIPLAAVALVWSILCLSSESVFVYFNF